MERPRNTIPTHFSKATGAIEISEPAGHLTLVDRRLFNTLLAHAYPQLGKSPRYTIHLQQIREFAAIARSGAQDRDNRRLKESILRLQRTTAIFNYLHSDKGNVWESSQLLGTCTITERVGELTYSFPEGLIDKLIEPALFSFISIRVIYQFESKYALILYEILKRYSDRTAQAPYWAVKTPELRDLLGCRDRLKDWKDLRRRALDPALEEIGRLSEFTVEMLESRQGGGRGGGQVVGVTFNITKKKRAQAEATVKELEKPRFQRRGEKLAAREDKTSSVALRWMSEAEPSVRIKWQKRALELGVVVPAKGAIAVQNLIHWVPGVAKLICSEERLSV
jgi:plasmid replication initiation protein